jgi:hypothetical protein
MGKYRAQMSLPGHLFGTVQNYDDDAETTRHWVSTGMLVRVDKPARRKPVTQPAEVSTEQPVKKPSARRARKTEDAATADPAVSDVVDAEDAAPDALTVEAPSSVMTSWKVSD